MADLKNLNTEEKAKFCSHIRTAMFHLASCWDALREAENLTEDEIETDEISGITSEVSDPSEAYTTLDQNIIEALMDDDQGGDNATPHQCQNCERLWSEESLKPIADVAERVAPGEPMPAGECPACGAVCHERQVRR